MEERKKMKKGKRKIGKDEGEVEQGKEGEGDRERKGERKRRKERG